ncbi:MAG TPA: SAM-dependent chlorinase/fluorinase [Polyangiaceae bacterium]|nr:SAM-dependent chlorinase/fluorinase [Polyangiaceae bacterium]
MTRALPGVVSLLTDFGLSDPYVGILKGVIAREAPGTTVIDVSHDVPPQDIELAALWLEQAYTWFPPGTVHVCVVDPGVGTARAALAARAGEHWFVAPDNGVLSGVLAREPSWEVRWIDAGALRLSVASRTFHGRDVFAPVAGRLASGALRLSDVGPEHAPTLHARRAPRVEKGEAFGEVIAVDRFGNLITNLPASVLEGEGVTVEIRDARLRSVGTYAEGELECVALVGSFGLVEIAVQNASAAARLGVGRGEPVRVVRGAP